MRFFILSGSHRPESQSMKTARFIAETLAEEVPGAGSFVLGLGGNPLPLWEEEAGGVPDALWEPVAQELRAADALVVVCPEWGGMATPGVKNFLLTCTADDVGHKPGLIVTVSAGRGGTYPVAELRMSGTKNNRLAWIPEQVIVQHAASVLNAQAEGEPLTKEDTLIRARLRYALRVLAEYGAALRAVRASGVVDHATYRNGM